MAAIIERVRKPTLLLRAKRGSVNKQSIKRFLVDLKKARKGRKILLFWDGLSAHRAEIVKKFISENERWLRVERLPAYAPEINPAEYLWSALKKRSANGEADLEYLMRQARRARERFSNARLLKGFLKASGLYD